MPLLGANTMTACYFPLPSSSKLDFDGVIQAREIAAGGNTSIMHAVKEASCGLVSGKSRTSLISLISTHPAEREVRGARG